METTLQLHRYPLISILVASTLLIGLAEPPPSYRFDLIHVDATGNFTREELIHHAAQRTFLREATLSAMDLSASTEYLVTTVEANYSHYEYLMKLEIGSPPKPFMAVADTGSDVTWTKEMKLCDETTSASLTSMTCSQRGPRCSDCFEGRCMFRKTYGSKKITAIGFMRNEMLILPPKKNVSIPIGCAFDCGDGNCHRLLPKTADGLVGLSRSPNSLLAQLNVTKFSYCLSSPICNLSKTVPRSQLWFGDGLTLGDRGAPASTSLVDFTTIEPPIDPNSVQANRYYIELHGISIGKKRIEFRSKNKEHKEPEVESFELRSESGKRIMFVDSGCTYSLLDKGVFVGLMTLLEKNGLKNTTSKEKYSTCFEGVAEHNRPQMVLHFTGANMTIPWTSYMLEDKSVFCLTIKETDKGVSILGNFQQQNIRMLYDLLGNKLSFVPVGDCGKV